MSPFRPLKPHARRLPLAALALALATAWPALASAQSLQQLLEAARGYDATYRAAHSLAQSD